MAVKQDIWHGDSIELLPRLHARRNVRSIITDPPFGVDNQSNMAVTASGKEHARKIANDSDPQIAMEVFTDVMTAALPAMMDESDIYIFTSHQVLEEWLVFTRQLLEPHGYRRKAIMTWEKDGPGMGDLNTWGMGVEFILYFKRGNRLKTAKRRNAVFHVPQVRPNALIHPHEKPLPLLNAFIEHSTMPGEFVLDPFGGSGSLARAARSMGRSALCIELDEKNFTMAKRSLDSGHGEGMF